MKTYLCLFLSFFLVCHSWAAETGQSDKAKYRVIVSTDIGGTDADDFQSMIHLLLYADTLDIEGLISSPFGPGRKQDILDVIDLYANDYPKLSAYSDDYPSAETLRSITKQGETEVAPHRGYRHATEGSNWIIERARAEDDRPLYILVWGGLEDLAQALHDAPDILPKIRVYYIGGPNKKWSPDAYQYLVDDFPFLSIIEANTTYRGWSLGGNQDGEWENTEFVNQHVANHGYLGDFFATQLKGKIKMGDTPSVAWLLYGDPNKPYEESWGGQFVRAWKRPYSQFQRLTTEEDEIPEFSILELVLPLGDDFPDAPEAKMLVGNQKLVGFFDDYGQVHFRFSPKKSAVFSYKLESNVPQLDGKAGAITATLTDPDAANHPYCLTPFWWTDDPDPALSERSYMGVKTVNRWRVDYLSDFAKRLERIAN